MDQNQNFNRSQFMPPASPEAKTTPVSPSGPTATSQTSSPDNKKPLPKKSLIIGLVVILLIIGVVAAMSGRKDTNSAANTNAGEVVNQTHAPIPTINPSQPWMTFNSLEQPASGGLKGKVGEEMTIPLIGNSQGADVNGYDLLFSYDNKLFDIVEVETSLNSFQIYQFNRTTYYAVTGIKLLNVKDATSFNNTEILKLKVIPQAKGTYYIDILPEKGKETSKFVDNQVKIIKPQVQPIKLEIQ